MSFNSLNITPAKRPFSNATDTTMLNNCTIKNSYTSFNKQTKSKNKYLSALILLILLFVIIFIIHFYYGIYNVLDYILDILKNIKNNLLGSNNVKPIINRSTDYMYHISETIYSSLPDNEYCFKTC